MSGKLKGWLFALIIVVILLLPIIIDYNRNKSVEVISYDGYIELLDKGDFSLVYIGDTNNDEFVEVSDTLLNMKDKFEINVKAIEFKDFIDKAKDEFAIHDLDELDESEEGWIFLENGIIEHIESGSSSEDKLSILIDKYYNNVIPEEEIAYLTAKDAASYKKAINSKNIIMSVFGNVNCVYCNMYKPIFNDAVINHDIDIYYFDTAFYDKTEYSKVLDLKLKIPGECTRSQEEELLASNTPTPLTLFTRSGKVIGCISGYLPKENLEAKLKDIGMIK